MTLDQLNVALKSIVDNRAQVGANIAQLQEQLKSIPQQIQAGIEKQTKLGAEMDAAIAALQVVITDEQLLKQTEAQIAVNASSPPAAAGGSPAASQQSATGAAAPGDSGIAWVADQPAAATGDSNAAPGSASVNAPIAT
jgi:hypothetical protein